MAAKNSVPTSMKEYLKRYESNTEEDKKKKKKKSKTRPEATSVLVVDEDPVWQKPVNVADENDDSQDEEKPQIDEDIEVKRMRRLEQLKARRHYNAISEDGSGWVSLSDVPQNPKSNGNNSDMSPPRKRNSRYESPSPEKLNPLVSGRDSTDLSPPRQRKRYHTPSPEPERRTSRSIDLNPDMSPPRRTHPQSMVDIKMTNSETPNMSPPHRIQRSSPDLDLSPPRQSRRRYHSPSFEPEKIPSSVAKGENDIQRGTRPYVDHQKASQKIELSPPRREKKDSGRQGTLFFSTRQPHQRSTEDNTLPTPVSDLSPPRKSRKELSSMIERPKTGLVTGRDIKEEITKTKNDDWKRFQEMDPSISGRGAQPVYRDKIKGIRITKDEFTKSQRKEEKPKEKKLEWGKGLAQKREAEEREIQLELEKEKPFARTKDDPELDKMLKQRVRWGDPMAHLVKKSQYDELLPNLGDNEKMTESGFVIPQDIPNHSWIKRRLEPAPNRYGIRPGRHWDGVDRSNGFEKGMFKRTNDKEATQKEAYMWSVSDM